MTIARPEIEICKQFQEYVYFSVEQAFGTLPAFAGKTVSIAYCSQLVLKDLDDLYQKRHFNFSPSDMMKFPPNPETTIPLGVCMYIDRIPVAYAIGDISDERQAFEIHFIETSNYYGNTGLQVWIPYLIEILLALRHVLADKAGIDIRKLCIVNPIQSTIGPLAEMGFDFTHEYQRSMSASTLHLDVK